MYLIGNSELHMRSLTTISGYDHIDNEFDKYLLKFFINSLFTPVAYNIRYILVNVEGIDSLIIPEGSKIEHFMNWLLNFPKGNHPFG